jgi:hypothetical protein
MKLPIVLAALLAALIFNSSTDAAGLVQSNNFIVMAPNQALAKEVLKAAETHRKEVAVHWLGAPLPPSIGAAVIHVELSQVEDSGRTWAKDHPSRKYHKVWLETSQKRAVGATLKHEITHVVLATRFPTRLPTWLEEGCASFADDAGRQRQRKLILDWYARTDKWPSLHPVLNATAMAAADQTSYAIAASLTEFLMKRGGQATLLAFAEAVKSKGLDNALDHYYELDGVKQLNDEWKSWYLSRNAVARGGAQKTR